jgi:hypothetical protein
MGSRAGAARCGARITVIRAAPIRSISSSANPDPNANTRQPKL